MTTILLYVCTSTQILHAACIRTCDSTHHTYTYMHLTDIIPLLCPVAQRNKRPREIFINAGRSPAILSEKTTRFWSFSLLFFDRPRCIGSLLCAPKENTHVADTETTYTTVTDPLYRSDGEANFFKLFMRVLSIADVCMHKSNTTQLNYDLIKFIYRIIIQQQ